MRALLSTEVGASDKLTIGDVPRPVAGAGQVVIDVKACALNYPDVLIIEDKYQFKPPRPFAPGSEVAGIISAIGSGVEGFAVGDRVMACCGHGGLAEAVVLSPDMVFPLPAEQSFEQGAALLMTYGTSLHALVDRGRLEAGQTLLILGAAGGVGLAAIEIGKALGARVVAAVSSAEKADFARDAGADETLIYGSAPFDKEQSRALAQAFKAASAPDGAHVIYDSVGGDYCEPALRSIAWEGRYLVVGFPAGIPRLPLNLTLLKSCDVAGVFWGAFAMRSPRANRANIARLMEWWAAGKITPRVTEVFPLERGAEAIAQLGNRSALGKLVVRL